MSYNLRRSQHDKARDRSDHHPHPSSPEPAPRPLELFPAPRRDGSRFDSTVAQPIHAPRRLEQARVLAGSRLAELPGPAALTHRTISYRSQLIQIRHDITDAQLRLRDGSYGTCLGCGDAISLARLDERPWVRDCIYCALGLRDPLDARYHV
jgi:DnaK suppressor protein